MAGGAQAASAVSSTTGRTNQSVNCLARCKDSSGRTCAAADAATDAYEPQHAMDAGSRRSAQPLIAQRMRARFKPPAPLPISLASTALRDLVMSSQRTTFFRRFDVMASVVTLSLALAACGGGGSSGAAPDSAAAAAPDTHSAALTGA